MSKDTLYKYPARDNFYMGEFTKMEDSKFDSASALLDQFPHELIAETDTVFGCPNCADQEGYYLEVWLSDTHKFWIIDASRGSVPEYLHEFMDEIDETIGLID